MKKCLLVILVFASISNSIIAQSPQSIPYQAVARNSTGNLLVNHLVSLRFTIHDISGSGTVLYQETQSVTTNNLGLFSVNIGTGTVVTGTFSSIAWGNGNAKYTQVEIDPTGGNSYTNMGAAQMMSVPYALYAASAGAASGAAGGDLTGTYPNPSLIGIGTAGTYTKVTTDSKGRVTAGTTLSAGDVPAGNNNYIQNGTSVQSPANFNISGNGTMGGNFSVGGTSYFGGFITGMNGIYPANNMVRLTPNLHFNSGQHAAVILNWDNGNSGTDLNLRVGNGASSDVFDVLANGTVGINTTNPAYTLDLNGGTFGFGLGEVRTEQRLDAGLQGNAGAQSGFFQNDGSTVTDYPAGASGWWHLIDCRHSNNSNNYAMQFANSFFDQNLYFRSTNNNPAQAWERVLTSTDISGTTNYVSKFTSTNAIGNSQLFDNGTNVGVGTSSPNGKLDVYNSGSNGDGAVFAPDITLDNNFTIQTYIDATGTGGWADRTTYAGTCCNNLALQPDVGTVSIGGTSSNYGSNKLNVLGQSYFSGFVGLNTTTPNRRLDISAGTGDGITFGQTQDNTETIQTYIDGQFANRATYASGCCNLLAIQPDVGQVCIGAMSATAKFEINLSNPLGWSGNCKANRIFAPDNGYYLDLNTYIVAGGNVGYQFSPNANTGMVITTPGWVGIGTTTPGYVLDVNGNFHTVSNASDAGYTTLNGLIEQSGTLNASLGLRITGTGGGATIFGNGASLGINVGQMPTVTSYGPVYASGFTAMSDITMKKDVQYLAENDFVQCLGQIRNIQSIRFRYKSESDQVVPNMPYRPNLHIGVVAQSLPVEVSEEMQADPSGASKETKLGMSLPDMSGLLLAGVKALDNHQQSTDEIIKQQQQQIDELKKEIEDLKSKK